MVRYGMYTSNVYKLRQSLSLSNDTWQGYITSESYRGLIVSDLC